MFNVVVLNVILPDVTRFGVFMLNAIMHNVIATRVTLLNVITQSRASACADHRPVGVECEWQLHGRPWPNSQSSCTSVRHASVRSVFDGHYPNKRRLVKRKNEIYRWIKKGPAEPDFSDSAGCAKAVAVYKPNFVGRPKPAGDHFSGIPIARNLKQPTRGVLCVLGRTLRIFGLAAGGVYPAVRVTPDAVRSYRTISPLPREGI
jgi:hypothetical protein